MGEHRALTQGIGDDWLASGASALLGVPSAVMSKSRSYLLNPHHPDAAAATSTGIADHFHRNAHSTTPAAHCSAPSGALGTPRPDLPPPPPPQSTARPIPGGEPLCCHTAPSPPQHLACSHRPRLDSRAEDRSGLAQVLRTLQYPLPFTHFPTPPAAPSPSLPSGSSSCWKRLRWRSRAAMREDR